MSSTPDSAAASPRELPPAVRVRVIALADETLAAMADEEVPASLRAVRRFTPAKRARLGATSLGAALETEPAFRAAVVDRIRAALPALAAALDAGSPAPAVPPADVAAVAYLLESSDWPERVAAARPVESEPAEQTSDEPPDRLRVKLEAVRASAREEAGRLRAEVADLRREAEDLRRKLSSSESAVRRAAQAQELAEGRIEEGRRDRTALDRELSAQIRRLRGKLRDAQASAAAARRGTRSERDSHTARLRVLLDTVSGAAAGLRRELDLPGGTARPAELEAQEGADDDPQGVSTSLLASIRRGRAADAPALVDEILAVPGVHLIVDGYNVTKLGYAALTLEDQRSRLVGGLTGMAARASGAELTCVFDAKSAVVRAPAVGSPRGLRVLFSAPGELADQLIVRLVAAEPQGRPVVVVTNDREVISAVHRAGGETLPSTALLGRLERG